MMFRRLATINHQSLGGKGKESDIWPMEIDKSEPFVHKIWGTKEEFTKLREAAAKAHGIKLFKDE